MPDATFFDRLNAIPWAELYHSYGSAENVPDLIAALLSRDPDIREQARDDLLYSLDHQGVQRWESTARLVPFLIELLNDPAVPDRHRLAPLLADFATGSADGVYLYTGFHIDLICTPEGTREFGYFVFGENQGGEADLAYGKLLRSIYEEVARGLPVYLALLTENQHMRVFIPHLLAWLTGLADEIVPPLLAVFMRERDPLARASQALALSYLTTFEPGLRDHCRPWFENALAQTHHRLEKLALGIALLRYPEPAEHIRFVLLDPLLNPPQQRVDREQFPWATLDEGAPLINLLFKFAPIEWKPALVRAMCVYLSQSHDENDALYMAEGLLSNCFPVLPPDEQPQGYDSYRPVTLESLNDVQQLILHTFAASETVWHYANISLTLNSYGLPVYRDRLQKFLAGEGDVMRFRYKAEHPEAIPAVPDFFQRLNAIRWQESRHGMGRADDLPDMLRALLAPKSATRRDALHKVYRSLLYYDNLRPPAALLAVPFLIDIGTKAAVTGHEQVLALLADVLVNNARGERLHGYRSETYFLRHGFHLERQYSAQGSYEQGFALFYKEIGGEQDLAYGKFMHSLYAEVLKGLPLYLELLANGKLLTRIFIPLLCSILTTEAARIVPVLLRQIEQEAAPEARASQALALRYLTLFDVDLRQCCQPVLTALFEDAIVPVERLALAVALLPTTNPVAAAAIMPDADAELSLHDEILKILVAWLKQPADPRLKLSKFPWARLYEVPVLLDTVLESAPPAWMEELVAVGAQVMAQTRHEHTAQDLAEVLLQHCFTELEPDERMELAQESDDAGNMSPFTGLSTRQQTVLRTIIETDRFWQKDGYPRLALLGYGFSGYREDLQKYVRGE